MFGEALQVLVAIGILAITAFVLLVALCVIGDRYEDKIDRFFDWIERLSEKINGWLDRLKNKV